MENVYGLIEIVNEKVETFIRELETFRADELGLDTRCGYLYANEDCIVVGKSADRLLQYYGGFEYVDKEYRFELGNYVVYLGEDKRVGNHLARIFEKDEDEE